MTKPELDLIAAIASAPEGSGRGIIRISGLGAATAIHELFSPDDPNWTQETSPRRWNGTFRLTAQSGSDAAGSCESSIPVAVYHWPSHRSYTGEPLIEIHAPGSPVLLERMLSGIFVRGVRPARRGEFTLRAFLAGKIDLVQAEGVLGTIDARDSDELKRALSQLAGGISRGFVEMRNDLLNLLADLEAGLDFTDEGLTFVTREDVLRRMDDALGYLQKLRLQAEERLWSRELPTVVITGPTNAGKSTLFNALAGEEAAIVSAEAGTTRDLVSRDVCWEGVALKLIDSAGDEAAPSVQVADGLRLRDEELQGATVVLICGDLKEELSFGIPGIDEAHTIQVRTKTDLQPPENLFLTEQKSTGVVSVSAKLGEGIVELRSAVLAQIRRRNEGEESLIGTTAARCRHSLDHGIEGLLRAKELVVSGEGDEFVTQELRMALEGLGEITGEVYTEDLLDRIFSRFCIGK
ncbi:MAG: 50S ribosome-binding GTPase [Planctomycetaceae bacterium]|nr:50S ribosome-binding GTPase [Planctomycetaceae bacterium]